MDVFNKYSEYYDQIYGDKKYHEEVRFIRQIIKKYSKSTVRSVLSLGCGTCNHDILLAKSGYRISAVDQSSTMLDIAREKLAKEKINSIRLINKDIRNLGLIKKHDMAMAMFNVWGYLIDNRDTECVLDGVAHNLKKGGLLIFDCWHQAAVLTDRPGDRIRVMEQKNERLIRITKSQLDVNRDLITIKFNILKITDRQITDEAEETHLIRYWSIPELKYILASKKFEIIKVCNFLNADSEPSDTNWNIFIVARKI
jgi:predicted TPR repeat methyltransferase